MILLKVVIWEILWNLSLASHPCTSSMLVVNLFKESCGYLLCNYCLNVKLLTTFVQLTVYRLRCQHISCPSHLVLLFHQQALNVSFPSCVKLLSMEDFSVVQTRHGLLWREYSLLELVTHLQTRAESL